MPLIAKVISSLFGKGPAADSAAGTAQTLPKGSFAMADSPQITAYLKPVCGWSNGVRQVFSKYGLEYEDKDIINNPSIYAEMVQKSGQPLSPCVEVNGQMLADVSGEEVEAWLLDNKVVGTVSA